MPCPCHAGLPETSSNLGKVIPSWSSSDPGTANFTILVAPRSMNTPALRRLQDELDRLVRCTRCVTLCTLRLGSAATAWDGWALALQACHVLAILSTRSHAAQAAAFGGRRQNLNDNADGIIPAWAPEPHSPLANLTAEVMSEVAGGCCSDPMLHTAPLMVA